MKSNIVLGSILLLLFLQTGYSEIKSEKPVMYYFYGRGCISCEAIKKEIDNISKKYKNKLILRKFEVWYNKTNRKMLIEMAKERGVRKSRLGTPTTIIGKDLYVGNNIKKIESLIKKNI